MQLSQKQYQDLIDRQNELNEIINPQWREERTAFDFQTAMTVEATEFIDHCAYKWWKKGNVDVKQAQMEVIDCWFFYLSALILDDKAERAGEDIVVISDYEQIDFDGPRVIEKAMALINCISSKSEYSTTIVTYRLWLLTRAAGLSVSDMYEMYMAKLVLNIFRQTHGYTDGTYIKIWNGLEDNEVLHKLMKVTSDPVKLETMLELHYEEAKRSK